MKGAFPCPTFLSCHQARILPLRQFCHRGRESVLHLPGNVRGGVPEGVGAGGEGVYAADKTITMPYKDNLQSLLHEPSFRFAVDRNVWSVLPSIVKAGNLAVHTGHSVSAADAVFSLRGLFDFIQGWITATARTMWSAL